MQLFGDEVADGVKAGDPDAVGAVYVALSNRLLGYLMARVRDRATAEDLLEATFVELLEKGHTIRGGPAAIKVWLFRAAHFNALDLMRKRQRRAEDLREDLEPIGVVDEELGPEDVAVAHDTSRRVRRAMAELSEDQRQVLLLRYVGGLSAPEVAGILSKSDGAVRSLQHRGERALAKILAPEFALGSAGTDEAAPLQAHGASTDYRTG